jgi:HD superfamily phosphohydrolase
VLNGYRPGFADTVADVLRRGPETVYGSIVSSQFDADRLDYVRRDRLMTGTRLARIDFDWLLANLEIGDLPLQGEATPKPDERRSREPRRRTFVLGPKAIYAAESFVVGLFQMYPTVYLHKTTRGAEKLAQFVLERVASHVAKGDIKATGLPESHPLVALCRNPDDLATLAELDDTVIYGALPMFRQASSDEQVRDFSDRLLNRRFFKAIDLLALPNDGLPKRLDPSYEKQVLQIRASVEQDVDDWSREAKHHGRILLDYAVRRPYKQIDEELSLNHIWIREGSELIPLRERSETVAAIGAFHAFRAYVAENDVEARRFVESCVRKSVKRE